MRELEQNLQIAGQDIDPISREIDSVTPTSYDGTCIRRISSFSKETDKEDIAVFPINVQ